MSLSFSIYCALVALIKLALLIFLFTSPKALDEYTIGHQLMFYSIWMVIAQMIYFLFEFIASLIETSDTWKLVRRYLINLIFTPSILVLSYFILIVSLDWTSKYSDDMIMVLTNLGIHGFNIINLVLVVLYNFPYVGKLHNNYIRTTILTRNIRAIAPYFLAYVLPVTYWLVATIYSTTNEKLIYPSNLFSFSKIDGKKSYAVEVMVLMFYLTLVVQASFTYICDVRLKNPKFDTESYL